MVEPKIKTHKQPQLAKYCAQSLSGLFVLFVVLFMFFFGSESHKMNSPCIINHKATARKLISRHYDYLNEEVVAGQR